MQDRLKQRRNKGQAFRHGRTAEGFCHDGEYRFRYSAALSYRRSGDRTSHWRGAACRSCQGHRRPGIHQYECGGEAARRVENHGVSQLPHPAAAAGGEISVAVAWPRENDVRGPKCRLSAAVRRSPQAGRVPKPRRRRFAWAAASFLKAVRR